MPEACDGDKAIAIIWQQVAEYKQRRAEVLVSVPATIRAAIELGGDAGKVAVRSALGGMPEAEATNLYRRLREGGLIRGSPVPDMTQVLNKFEPLLQGIAERNVEGGRAQIEAVLSNLEKNGWRLTEAIRHISGWRTEPRRTYCRD